MPLLSSMAAPRLSLDPETARLVARARDGEREAFGELLQRHLPAARRLALAALGRPADADEAVQDASLAAWKALASLETDEAFAPGSSASSGGRRWTAADRCARY